MNWTLWKEEGPEIGVAVLGCWPKPRRVRVVYDNGDGYIYLPTLEGQVIRVDEPDVLGAYRDLPGRHPRSPDSKEGRMMQAHTGALGSSKWLR